VKQGILHSHGESVSCGLCSCNESLPEVGFRASKNPFTAERSSAMSMKNVEITLDASLIEDSPQQAAGNALAFAVQRSFGPR
jgi:hypothetical protein